MSEKDWWYSYGPFRRWQECPNRPAPEEVLLFYLARRNIKPAEHVDYLMNLLNLQKSMVYLILKGEGFDAISRCRELVVALKIHPPLLGIDAQFYPIEHHQYWWREYGFPFNADAQGYPMMSEVIAYLRIHRTHVEENGRVKTWSQEDLGDATGLKKETVYRAEHEKNPLILESMSRRAIIASALGNLAGENEHTLFRLFGLDPQAYGVPVPDHESIAALHLSTKELTDEMVQERHKKLHTFFMEYYTSHAQDRVGELLELLSESQALLPLAHTATQKFSILALQSRSHRLLACLARETCEKGRIILHTSEAVKLAEQARLLPNPKLDSDPFPVLTMHELFAAALFTRAMASYELDQYDLARKSIDQAFSVLPTVQSCQLKTEILAATALIHASTARNTLEKQTVLSYMQRAFQTSASRQSQVDGPDDNFFWCDRSMLYIYKAEVLSCSKMKGMTYEKISDILKDAQRLADPKWIRRQVLIEVLYAQAHFAEGSYQQATEDGLLALEKSRFIRSRLNRNRLEGLYKQLLDTSYRDKPDLAYLAMKLRTWDHGIK